VLALEFVANVQVPSAKAQVINAGRIRIFEVGMMPVQKPQILFGELNNVLVLPDAFVHRCAEGRIVRSYRRQIHSVRLYDAWLERPSHLKGSLGS
jgi:hypothetical protein